jgi:hypothetical protein
MRKANGRSLLIRGSFGGSQFESFWACRSGDGLGARFGEGQELLTGVLAGLAAGALWGLVFVAPRMLDMGAGGYSSVDLTAGRFAVYGVVAAAVMLLGFRHRRLPTLRQAAAALLLSVLGFSGYYLMLVLAIRDAGTEVPSLIIGTIPVWIMLLGKPQGLRWRALLPGLALTLAGLLLMMGSVQAPGQGPPHFWRGMAFVVVSLVCWTMFAILNSAWLKRHPEVRGHRLGQLAGHCHRAGRAADVGGGRLRRARAGGPRRQRRVCPAVRRGRFWLDLAGHHLVEHGQPAAQRQPVRPAHRERDAVCAAVFFCLGRPLAHGGPGHRLRAVHAGHHGVDTGAPLMH